MSFIAVVAATVTVVTSWNDVFWLEIDSKVNQKNTTKISEEISFNKLNERRQVAPKNLQNWFASIL